MYNAHALECIFRVDLCIFAVFKTICLDFCLFLNEFDVTCSCVTRSIRGSWHTDGSQVIFFTCFWPVFSATLNILHYDTSEQGTDITHKLV